NLYFAAWTGDREILQMLVREGEDVTMQDSYGWTALHLAVWNMHTDIVRFLLQTAAQVPWVSTQSQNCLSALHLATCNNDVEVIKILLNVSADLSLKDHNGGTPMHWAAQNGHS